MSREEIIKVLDRLNPNEIIELYIIRVLKKRNLLRMVGLVQNRIDINKVHKEILRHFNINHITKEGSIIKHY